MNDHQLEDRIRAAIRVIADEPVFAPPPQRVPASEHRPRQTFRRWAPAVAALTVVVITAVVVTNPFPRPAQQAAEQATTPPSNPPLPIRVPASSPQLEKLSESPLGRPALALVYQGPLSAEPGGRQAVLMAEGGQAYRRLDLAEQRGAVDEQKRWYNATTLLSPDGRKVAVGDGRGGATDMVIVDAVTGERRVYPLAKPVYYRLLAWSPDGKHVVMVMRDEPRRSGESDMWRDKGGFRVALIDVETGSVADIGDATVSVVVSAHFSPAGGLVVAEPNRLRFFELATGPVASLVRTVPKPDGGEFAGWSKEQSMLVFVNMKDSGTSVWFRDVADDSTPRRPIYLEGKVAMFAGWKSPDEILLYTSIANMPSSDQLVVASMATGQITPLAAFDDPDAIGVRVATRLVYSDVASSTTKLILVDPEPEDRRKPWVIWVSSGVLLVLLTMFLVRRRRKSAS